MIREQIQSSIDIKKKILADEQLLSAIQGVADEMIRCYRQGGKVLLCGNGGSAADAQHIAAELAGKFLKDREPLFALALHANSSFLTAVANDYSYDEVFSRMVKAAGRKGDVLIGISTSGKSPNILKAMKTAKNTGMFTVGLAGEKADEMKKTADHIICIPSKDTPRIQECHILIGHIICEIVEKELFS